MMVENQYDAKIDLSKLIFWFHLPETTSRAKSFFINKFKNFKKHNESYYRVTMVTL